MYLKSIYFINLKFVTLFMLLPKPVSVVAIEATYSSIIFVVCILLFYKVREIYKISEYKGFYLFSNTFLYLGLAYFVRFGVSFLLISSKILDLELSFGGVRSLILFSLTFMVYLSSVAILYLISSLIWKWINVATNDLLIHLTAILMAIVPVLFKSIHLFVALQVLLIFALIVAIFVNYKHREVSKRYFKQAYAVYLLMFIFWILNFSLLLRIIPPKLKGVIYLLSLLTIGVIAYKVFRKL